jgi:predicted GTPase
MADVIVVNKVDSADLEAVAAVVANAHAVNPTAAVVRAASPVTLQDGPSLVGARVLVVEDGPTITHGGMPYGAGTVAARQGGATQFADPRPHAVGSIADTFDKYPGIGLVLPAMGYGDDQLHELAQTIRATPCDVVVAGTPIDLGRVVGDTGHPIRRVTYELRDVGTPNLADVLTPLAEKWARQS